MCGWRRWTASALLAAMPMAGGTAWAADDEPNPSGDLVAAIAQAAPEADDNGHHKLKFAIELADGIHFALTAWEIEAAGLLGGILEATGPLAVAVATWMEIGGAHAEAIKNLTDEQLRSGFSLGVVLGADDRPPAYVKEFFKRSPVPTAVYPEYGPRLRDAHNAALAAGYTQGRRLLESKTQRAAFFEDIFARMSNYAKVDYLTDNSTWSESTWRSYYHDCASTFRAYHLEE